MNEAKTMKRISLFLLLIGVVSILKADPPDPPLGKRWIFNPLFSEEFNGTSLDLTKWYDHHPSWIGRAPGLFLPSQVSVANGYMTIRGEKMASDTVITHWDGRKEIYNIKAGAVVSRSLDAYFGYYECRFKAAKTTMSTTFWMSTRKGYPGPEPCGDRYGLELDIQECIGREGPFDGAWFASGMNSNSHYWYTGCDGIKHDYRAEGVEIESESLASEDFNTYGGWWQDESNVVYYFNNGEGVASKFYDGITDKPFDRPMGINLVSETYPFPWIELPNDEELADSTKNICYYDWVRSYLLVDVDSVIPREPLLINGDFEEGYFKGWRSWGSSEVVSSGAYEGNYCAALADGGSMVQSVELKPNTRYSLSAVTRSESGTTTFGIRTNTGNPEILTSVEINHADYQLTELEFTTGSVTSINVFVETTPGNTAASFDNIVLSTADEETIVFQEKVESPEKPGVLANSEELDFLLRYQSRADRELFLEILDDSGSPVDQALYPALGGFGKKDVTLPLDSLLVHGKSYTVRIYIRPLEAADNASAYSSDEFTFVVRDPAQVTCTIKDGLRGTLLPGAEIEIGELSGVSDQTGQVIFQEVPSQVQSLHVSAEGYHPIRNQEILIQNDTAFTVMLSPMEYRVLLYVRDAVSGQVLPGAEIAIGDNRYTTGGSGSSIVILPYGPNAVRTEAGRYVTTTDTILVTGQYTIDLLVYKEFARVKFSIRLDGAYLKDAQVTLGLQSQLTTSKGEATFDSIAVNRVLEYRVSKEGTTWWIDSSSFYADTTLQLKLNSSGMSVYSANSITLYPNPAGNQLRIKNHAGNSKFTIVSMEGVELLQGYVADEDPINSAQLPPGNYLLSIQSKQKRLILPFQKL